MRFLLFACLIVCCHGESLMAKFRRVVDENGDKDLLRSENPKVTQQRFKHFKECDKIIEEVNSDASTSFTLTTNEFSIMTDSEIQQHLGLNINMSHTADYDEVDSNLVTRAMPSSVDFRDAVPAIKNQGGCGSCWIFAATASMEFEVAKTTSKTKLALSDQEYLNCASGQCHQGNGCNGGWMSYCYDYNKRSNRIGLQSEIAYTARMQKCSHGNHDNALADNYVSFVKTHSIGGPSPEKMQEIAAEHVVSVAVEANSKFQLYKSGVYEAGCNKNGINHAVNIVGYDGNSWLVRNSWGDRWGENGHIRMERNGKDTACILYVAVYPELKCTSGRCRALDLNKYYNGGNNDNDNDNDDDSNNNDDNNNDEYGCFEESRKNAQLRVTYKNFKKEVDVQKACTKELHCIGYSQLNSRKFQMVVATEKKKRKASFKYKCAIVPDGEDGEDDCAKNGLVWCAAEGKCLHEHMCH